MNNRLPFTIVSTGMTYREVRKIDTVTASEFSLTRSLAIIAASAFAGMFLAYIF